MGLSSKFSHFLHKIILIPSTSFLTLIIKSKAFRTQEEGLAMKKVILLVILGLVVAGGMNEAGAMACCSGSNTGAGMTGGSHGTMPGGTDCISGHEMTASQSGMAVDEGTINYCDPVGSVSSDSASGHSGSHQHGIADKPEAPMGQKSVTMPGDRE
jgi:hypothetical protein